MNHLKRFYCDSVSLNSKIVLDSIQSHHLKNILRLKPDDLVEVFNSRDESYIAQIVSIDPKAGVELKVISKKQSVNLSDAPDITLACAIAKGSRMDWLVEKTAEIGLTKLIPIITERSVVKPDASSHSKITRWNKLAISAARQTGQNSILEISAPISFDSLGGISKDFSLSLIALPNADKYLPELLKKSNLASGKILYLIGPEGDFSNKEVNKAIEWGVQPVRLPVNSILRVETAAVTMLAMLMYQIAEMRDKR